MGAREERVRGSGFSIRASELREKRGARPARRPLGVCNGRKVIKMIMIWGA